jgi:hypothetical protein
MSYRVVKLPLTASRGSSTRAHTLARLSSRRSKLPKTIFSAFAAQARRVARRGITLSADRVDRLVAFQRQAAPARRHVDAARALLRGEAVAVIVPLLHDVAAPRMDEVLRIFSGLELARQLRQRKVGRVVTVLWPAFTAGEWGETGISAILQRGGELEDIGSLQADGAERWLARLRDVLPGTGFSSLLLDQLSRAADDDADLFKLRLLLRWFGEDDMAVLPAALTASAVEGVFGDRLRVLSRQVAVAGVVMSGRLSASASAEDPIPYPAASATIIEGKVESWLNKFSLRPEEVLSGELNAEVAARRNLPHDVNQVFNGAKERVLSEVLRFEIALNDLGFRPDSEIRKALTGVDIGFDKLRVRAAGEAGREVEVNQKQLGKLSQYLLPDGRAQQEVMSLLHFLNFYGFEFAANLGAVLQHDDVRHQAVYLADEATG